jgi:DNA polymerase
MIIGEAPGAEEVMRGIPFIGASGQELDRMLKEAGIMRSECFVTNVCRVRPPGNDINLFIAKAKKDRTEEHVQIRNKWVLPCIAEGIEKLKQEITMCRPNVIIALGNLSLWALTGNWGVVSWRGSELEADLPLSLEYRPKVIPTYHPAAVLYQWAWRPIAVHDLRKVKKESATKEIFRHDYKFLIRPTFGEAIATIDKIQKEVESHPFKLAVDIETRSAQIACIGFAWSIDEGICIPLLDTKKEKGYWEFEEELEIMWRLYKLLTHRNCHVIGQNFSYDIQYFYRQLCYMPNLVRDTMLCQHVLFSNLPKGLGFLSSMYCEHHLFWKDEGKTWDEGTGEEQLWRYNVKDCCATYEIDTEQQKLVDKMGMREVHDFQQELFHPVVETMNRGVRIDLTKRTEFAQALLSEIEATQNWINQAVGFELNVRSPLQMQNYFYGTLKQKPVRSRKTGNTTCDDEALNKISEREPLLKTLIGKIGDLRSLGVFYSTFVNAPLDVDQRMRCSFNIAGTETFRFSSSENAFGSGMNMQNIPKGDD